MKRSGPTASPCGDGIRAYLDLVSERPDLFAPSRQIPLVLDENRIRAFSQKQGRPMGLVYDNRPFYMVLADLCARGDAEYSYARVVYPDPASNGAVAIPRRAGKFGLLRTFRHPPRRESLEFPRGFAEKGLTPEENIRNELREELGADVSQIRRLGEIRADTGLSSGCVQAFLAEVVSADVRTGHEGIRELLWLSEAELQAAVARGEITDGFTLSALSLYACRREA